ncbi:MAG: SBBP repeat-containing protein [Saprospiraceae bacterium]|nr:SBBP repeat-containing protein [Saprospiraceae bacterium]
MRDWSTYHGGTNEDSFRDMAIDASGNVYVVGSTRSSNAISTPAAYQSVIAGGSDVFVAKYDTDGNRIWSTYFGGTGDDFGQSIDLDINGNIFITGLTFSNDGIATAGTHQTSFNGNGDVFIAKLDNNGFRIWGSYFGGSGFDFANDLEVDIMGNPIIIGWTNSNNNISSPGSFQTTYGAQDDILLAKFSTNGQLLWATYYGDAGFDTGLQVESDGMANIIISGWTSSLVNMTTSGAFQTTYGGNTSDNFIAKFDQAGNRLWATYYGGSGDDYADALLVNAAGDIYLSGSTNSPNNITTAGSFQPLVSTGYDVFFSSLYSQWWENLGHIFWWKWRRHCL